MNKIDQFDVRRIVQLEIGELQNKITELITKYLEEKDPWIPCDEKLPGKCGYVLASTANSSLPKCNSSVNIVYYDGTDWCWRWGDGVIMIPKGVKVLAWMPLPEPYQGDF